MNISLTKRTKDEAKAREEAIRKKHDFYRITTKNGKLEKLFITKVKFIDMLKDMGFSRYDIDEETHKLIRLQGRRLEEVNSTTIADHFCKYVDELEEYGHKAYEDGLEIEIIIDSEILKEKVYNSLETLFGTVLLKRMRIDDQIVFCRDLKGIKYIFYQNGFVEITADSTEFKEYDQFRAMYGKIRSFPGHTFRQMINRATFIHFAGM